MLVLKKKFRDTNTSASELPVLRQEGRKDKKKEKKKEKQKSPPTAAPLPQPPSESLPIPTINIEPSHEDVAEVSDEKKAKEEPLSVGAAAAAATLSGPPIEPDPDSVFETPPESRDESPEREVPPEVLPEAALPAPPAVNEPDDDTSVRSEGSDGDEASSGAVAAESAQESSVSFFSTLHISVENLVSRSTWLGRPKN